LEQGGKCNFCDRSFGSAVLINGAVAILKAEPDHFIPVAQRRNDSAKNISAACHVCNQKIKGSRRFESIEDARRIIRQVWDERGYKDCPPFLPYRATILAASQN
jgi:hypothetical protein